MKVMDQMSSHQMSNFNYHLQPSPLPLNCKLNNLPNPPDGNMQEPGDTKLTLKN